MLLFNFGKVPFQLSGSIVKIPFAYNIVPIENRSCLPPADVHDNPFGHTGTNQVAGTRAA